LYRDGLRSPSSLNPAERQRWLCRDCGYRFTQKEAYSSSGPLQNTSNWHLKARIDESSSRQVCDVLTEESKNLTISATRFGTAQRESTLINADVNAMLINYEAKLILKGLDSRTIQRRITLLKLLNRRGANLTDQASVFQTIDHAKKWNWETRQVTDEDWSQGSKNNAAEAYLTFCELLKIPISEDINFGKWGRQPQKLPWIPLETEIDQLISGSLRLVATFLLSLKETGMRCGEAIRLPWTDVDLEHGLITMNAPEKHSLPRQFKISGKLAAMLNCLPKKGDRVFSVDLRTMRKRFMWQRSKIAEKVQNPRLRRITFHVLRHWYGSMEYHKTKNILHVQERLGHRSITSTMIYTHLVNFESDEYHTATSKSLKEDEDLLKAGFDYVTERDSVKVYRKRK
jgi:integrase